MAREAYALGLATRLSDTPLDDAMQMAREIADRSPDAIRGAKSLLNRLYNDGAAAAVRRGAQRHRLAHRTAQPDRSRDGQLREARCRCSPIRLDESGHAMTVDPDKLKQYSFLLFTKLDGAVTSGMVHLGDRLGIYAAMRAAGVPLTSTELAGPRRVERAMGARVGVQPGGGEARSMSTRTNDSHLSPEAEAVLASPEHPAFGMGMFHRLPEMMGVARVGRVRASSPGSATTTTATGRRAPSGIERSFEPWNNAFLLPTVLPALDGVVDRLTGRCVGRRRRLRRRQCGAVDG